MLGFSLPAQTSKKTTGPTPPTLDEPGVVHPKPIPENDPASPPNVRQPVHETGKEKAVSSRSRSKRSRSQADSQQAESKKAPAPKVEQNGQIGGAQDPPATKKNERGQTAEPRRP
jgi:hypothetical protein